MTCRLSPVPRCLVALCALAWAGVAHAQKAQVREVPVGTHIDWSYARDGSPARYRSGDVELEMNGRPDPEMPELVAPVLAVRMPGQPSIELVGHATGPTFEHRVTIGRWEQGRPYVLFQSFSGGAHCCNTIQLVYPEDRGLRAVELGTWDGDYLDPLPTDIDGDGRIDFLFIDNAFLYAFAPYAGSLAPRQIINVEDGQAVDVSNRAAFRSLFADEMAEFRPGCVQDHGNSPCAAYVASAARAGQFDQAWAEMLEAYDRNDEWYRDLCWSPTPAGDCAEPAPDNFPDALRRFLVERGYIDR